MNSQLDRIRCSTLMFALPSITLAVAGCRAGQDWRAYDGVRLPSEEVSILVAKPLQTGVRIATVDGKRIPPTIGETLVGPSSKGMKVELLPGAHALTVCYFRDTHKWTPIAMTGYYEYSTEDLPLEFHAKAGRMYLLDCETQYDAWRPFIRDITLTVGQEVSPARRLKAPRTQPASRR